MKLLAIQAGALLIGALAIAPQASAQVQSSPCDLANLRPGLNTTCSITVDGRNRSFDVRVPAQLSPTMPITIDNHGFTQPGPTQRMASGLFRLVDRNKTVLITTQGVEDSWNGQGVNEAFRNSACCGDALAQRVDDLKYFGAVVDAVKTSLKLTPVVVASSGISNGMAIGNLITCTSDPVGRMFDVVAGVSFALPTNIEGCQARPGMFYSESHGTADTVVGIDGRGGFAAQINTGPAREVPKTLASLRGCATTAQETRVSDNTVCRTFSGCMGGGVVQMCEVANGQHGLYRNFDPAFTFDKVFENLLDQAVQFKTGATAAPAN
jgi:polyhydroxybutyrate depolymerase